MFPEVMTRYMTKGIEYFGSFASSGALGCLSLSVLFLSSEKRGENKIALNDESVPALAPTSWAASSVVIIVAELSFQSKDRFP
jgi:hypothetical protein